MIYFYFYLQTTWQLYHLELKEMELKEQQYIVAFPMEEFLGKNLKQNFA